MASSDGGGAFLGFLVGAVVVIVALIGAAVYSGHLATDSISQASIDMLRPSVPSNPR